MPFQPFRCLRLFHNSQNFDGVVRDIIENTHVIYAESVLRPRQTRQPFDATLGDLLRLVPEMLLDGGLDLGTQFRL